MNKQKQKNYGRLRRFIELFFEAFGQYRLQLVTLTGLGFLSGFFEAIGVNMLIPLLSFFTSGEVSGNDFITQFIEKMFTFVNIPFTLPVLLIFISALFFLKAFVLLLFSYVRIKISSRYEQDIRESLLKKTMSASWPYLLKHKLGHLETLLMVDVRMSAKLFNVTADVLMMVTSLVMYLIVAINISFTFTMVTLSAGAVLFFAIQPLFRRVRAISRRIVTLNKDMMHHVSESMLGIKVIKAMAKENIFRKVGSGYFDQFRKSEVKMAILSTLASVFIQPISVILVLGIFVFSFYYDPNYSFAALVVLIYLIHRIFSYIQMLQGNIQSINRFAPYLTDVLSYGTNSSKNKEDDSASEPFKFEKDFVFENVTFSYADSKETLKDVSFNIRKSEMIGLIGESGAGKTTIFDLILRLFQPSSGKILIDGMQISEVNLAQMREKISYVSQDAFLINNTIDNNIGFFDEEVSKDDIVKASKEAHIYDFIKTLPEGFKTVVGERGVRLSAGQRQRISIARALAKKPEILLLDEATSALDNESEVEIQKVIEQLKGDMTIFVIAHRLSTVMDSDKLYVLDNGKITEKGTPKELLENKESYFYKMYNIRK
ncbi:MAG: ABC transporter ATP-binding protein [Candidatus Pacebacteria bacterium]|nr:ABC transporter ATP-binding protein [Candidatus Paceibacterota bacterium]